MADKKKSAAEEPKKEELTTQLDKLPQEQQQQILGIKQKLEAFKDELLKKFGDNVVSVALLPNLPAQAPTGPTMQAPAAQQPEEKKDVKILVLIDDVGTKKTLEELKQQLLNSIMPLAKAQSEDFDPQILLISELWQSCFDGKDEITKLLTVAAPIYDRGTLAAVKISEIHKNMVLQQFERYIVSYVLAGSIVQGRATPESDIDVFIVVDDTDVKKMTRVELKDKLRAIIISKGIEAGEITGIRNKLNIQVYILTDFWEYVKDANPIIFTFLRDGVPLYDRGTFMPWKQLLRLGRIKPSQEAIDNYVTHGEEILRRVKIKLREIGMEDTFWSILTPTQAALMLYGVPPPTPKETADVVREIFVKKEKLLEEKYVEILEANVELRKNLEHGSKKELDGKELDSYLVNCEDYLKRLEKLFEELTERKAKESITHTYETVRSIMRDVLEVENMEQPEEKQLEQVFEQKIIATGKMQQQTLRSLKAVSKAQKQYLENKLSKTEVDVANKEASKLIRQLTEHIQRKRVHVLGKARIRVRHAKDSYGEVVLLGQEAYIIYNINDEEKQISKAAITEDGALAELKRTTEEEFEKALTATKLPAQTFIKERLFESLREFFGKDVEIQVI